MPMWTFIAIFVLQVVNLVFGGFILKRNPKSPLHQALAFFIFFAALWGFSLAIAVMKGGFFWAALPFTFGAFALFSLYWFSAAIPVKIKKVIPPKYVVPGAFVAGLLGFIPGAYFNEVEIINGSLNSELGPLYPVFLIFIVFCFVAGSVNFIRKYRKSSGILKAQFKYLLVGLSIFAGAVVVTNVLLPAIEINTFNGMAPSFVIIFVGFASYAMLRYRLMDVSSLLSRSLVYVFLVSAMTGLFASSSYVITSIFEDRLSVPAMLVYAAMSVGIVLLYDPLKRVLFRGSAAVFGSQNYEQTVSELAQIAQKELDMEKLISQVNTSLREQLHVKRSAILLPEGRGKFHSHHHTHDQEQDNPDAFHLKEISKEFKGKKEVVVRAELVRMLSDEMNSRKRKKIERLLKEFEPVGAEVLAPVFEKGKIKMVLALNEKVNGSLFTPQELSVLEVIGPQIAAALEKAELYQETLGFTEELKVEVAKATRRLQDNNQYLKELDKARAEFISITSHQLRTPLSGITGYLSMLSEGDYGRLDKEQARVVDDVLSASFRLTRMVNLFLNVSRIEAGRFIMNWGEAAFTDVVNDMVNNLQFNAEKKGLELTVDLPKRGIKPTPMDIDKAKDVIGNLIDNAIKYTDEGSVHVSVKDAKDMYEFRVKDTGIGINPKDAKRLFDKFARGTNMAKVGRDGSGLGLFIAKKVVDAHGGQIWAESEGLGKGSVFCVDWPKVPKKRHKQTKERVIVA